MASALNSGEAATFLRGFAGTVLMTELTAVFLDWGEAFDFPGLSDHDAPIVNTTSAILRVKRESDAVSLIEELCQADFTGRPSKAKEELREFS
jgi:hypothetical protein